MIEKLIWSTVIFVSMMLAIKMYAEYDFASCWGAKWEERVYIFGMIVFGSLFAFSCINVMELIK